MTVNEMKEKRAAIVEKARADYDKIKAEGRAYTKEDDVAFNRAMDEAESLQREIRTFERMANVENSVGVALEAIASNKVQLRANERPEYVSGFQKVMQGQRSALTPEETRALMTNTSDGSNLVSVEFERQIVQGLDEENIYRQAGFPIIKTSTTRQIPICTAGTQVAWLDEGETFQDSSPTFTNLQLKAYKVGALTWFSTELAEDNYVNLQAFLASDISRGLGLAQEYKYSNGSGTNSPTGLFTKAPVAKTISASVGIKGDDYIDLMGSVTAPYRTNGIFVAASDQWAPLMKLKNLQGDYIFLPSLRDNEPSRLLGRPIYFTSSVQGKVAFVDPRFFVIADRTETFVKFLDQTRITEGFYGMIAWRRTDSNLLLPEAASQIKIA